ncbi:hypothetical protein PVAG01_04401 [Phlyctema vagabunda]|uniref:Reverse transcriptase n=1 Tax=Phlyctema vagabunda TaxID=108571 RepID=A0ABR4PPA5_9HELO
MTSTDQRALSTISYLEWLPSELRRRIFREQLHWDGKKIPALLVALRQHRILYNEALDVFNSQNTLVLSNMTPFPRTRNVVSMLKHLEITNRSFIWQFTMSFKLDRFPRSMTCFVNLQSICIDLAFLPSACIIPWLKRCLEHMPKLRRFAFSHVTQLGRPDHRNDWLSAVLDSFEVSVQEVFDKINLCLGISGKLDNVVPLNTYGEQHAMRTNLHKEVWFWQKTGVGALEWKEDLPLHLQNSILYNW